MRTQEERDEQTLDIVFMLGGAVLILVGAGIVGVVGFRFLPTAYPVLIGAYFVAVAVALARRR